MPAFLRGPPEAWPELEQWHNNLGGSTWLNDGNIHSAYSMYRLADGSALPTTLKLLGPAEVQLLLHGQCGNRETLLEIDLDNRDDSIVSLKAKIGAVGKRPKGVIADHLSKIWSIDTDTAKRTIDVTTQLCKHGVTDHLSRQFSTND